MAPAKKKKLAPSKSRSNTSLNVKKAKGGGASKQKSQKKGATAAPSKKTVKKEKKKLSPPKRRQSSIEAEKLKKVLLKRKGFRLRIFDRVYNIVRKWRRATSQTKIKSSEQHQERREQELRYRRPVEKLLKCIKKERLEEIPPDVNIHRHPIRRASWAGSRGVRKQVELIHSALRNHNRPLQPNVGWTYNKRQKRLLLGRRHRYLEKGWRYFEPLKHFLPRNIRPNSRLPDALFFICTTILFLSIGIPAGALSGIGSVMHMLEDAVEYKLAVEGHNLLTDELEGHKYWEEHAQFEYFVKVYVVLNSAIGVLILLGLIGVYITDQKIHCIYGIGVSICLTIQFVIAQKGGQKDLCRPLIDSALPILELLVANYYEKIEAIDTNGTKVMWNNPTTGNREVVRIRTYRATNLMDRIQKNWQCCGVVGFSDYESKGLDIPSTCCNPLWNLNPYCGSKVAQGNPKLLSEEDGPVGCKFVLERFCKNAQGLIGLVITNLLVVQFILFLISCIGLVMQARQIRQLKRPPHLRVPAGTISQSLQTTSGADAAVKTGRLQAVAEASILTQKQTEQLQQMRFEATRYKKFEPVEAESSSSTPTSSSDDAPLTTIDFEAMENLQDFVDKEGQTDAYKTFRDKAVEGFAGRFNIVANKNLHPYVPGIFSTTFQNETNAGLEAINNILERQFAQHTTVYNWRKLLVKPKKEDISIAPSQTSVALRKKGG